MNTSLWSKISDAQAQSERGVRWVYVWLLISAFITVPWMVISWPRQQPPEVFDYGEPAWSPDGRSIAFFSNRDGNREIYVMNPDGTNQRNLAQNPATDYDPAWSPDGRLIAFSSNREGNFEIYVMTADGTNPRRLTNNPASDENPSWSPDGRSIAFYSNRDGNREIYVMNADGTNQRNLTNNSTEDWPPAWSPNGNLIAFSSKRDGNWEIYVMNADGTNPRNLTNNPADDEWPAWSPDGRFIAFQSKRDGNWDICVMNADGTDPRNLTNNRADDDGPSWSPNGQEIAFASARDGSSYSENIYLMNTDGSGIRKLTQSIREQPAPPMSDFLLAVTLPALVHIILLFNLFSSNLYVRRHTQQASVLVALRVLSTVLLVGLTRGAYWQIWVVMNGSLWLFGSVWGLRQVGRGDCWLMRLRGEGEQLPRPWAVPAPAPAVAPVTAPVSTPVPVATTVPVFTVPADSQAAFESGQSLVSQGKRKEAIECFMFVFRNGTRDLRQRAIAELEKLGEVEKG